MTHIKRPDVATFFAAYQRSQVSRDFRNQREEVHFIRVRMIRL